MATIKKNDPIITPAYSAGNKLTHLLVIVSILVTSCQWKPGSWQAEGKQDRKGIAGVVYSARSEAIPVFDRPVPKVSTHSDNATEIISQEK